jgi:hypothetical protein
MIPILRRANSMLLSLKETSPKPLLTPVNEQDNEELDEEHDQGPSQKSQQRRASKHGKRTTGNGPQNPCCSEGR